MSLKAYFDGRTGLGVLSTADREGRVNSAIYGRPLVVEGGQVAFLMADRLTRANLVSNPKAAYLFREDGQGYKGVRLKLTKIREEKNKKVVASLRRNTCLEEVEERVGPLFLVYFNVDEEWPLTNGVDGGSDR